MIAGVVCCSLLFTSCGVLPTEEEFDAAPVVNQFEGNNFNKVAVTKGTLKVTEEIMGKYQGTVREEVVADGAGIIKKIDVKKGQYVHEGDVLFSYLLPGSEETLKSSNEEIEKLKLMISQANRLKSLELKKAADLKRSSSEKNNIANQYNQQIKSYESNMELLKMDVKIAKEEIEAEEVTASVSGRVKELEKGMVGTYGNGEEPIMVIEGKKRNRFKATSEFVKYCKDKQSCTISVRGQEYKAIMRVPKDLDDTVYFYTKAGLSVEEGTVCSYEVVLKEMKDILYLPSALIYSMGDKNVVYYEDENGLKATKEVKIGEVINNFTQIVSGLNEGDKVISN